jgi:hypothetical protein
MGETGESFAWITLQSHEIAKQSHEIAFHFRSTTDQQTWISLPLRDTENSSCLRRRHFYKMARRWLRPFNSQKEIPSWRKMKTDLSIHLN